MDQAFRVGDVIRVKADAQHTSHAGKVGTILEGFTDLDGKPRFSVRFKDDGASVYYADELEHVEEASQAYEMVHASITSSVRNHKHGYGFQFDAYSTEQANALERLLIESMRTLQQRLYVPTLTAEKEQTLLASLEERIAALRLWLSETRVEGEQRLRDAGYQVLGVEESEV